MKLMDRPFLGNAGVSKARYTASLLTWVSFVAPLVDSFASVACRLRSTRMMRFSPSMTKDTGEGPC